MSVNHLETTRLILRPIHEKDLNSFAQMNSDLEVMRYFPAPLSQQETLQSIHLIQDKYKSDGFCFLACELKDSGEFIGFVGLNKPSFEAHFTPCVEIGWRIARPFWRQGYAFEGAQRMLNAAFEDLQLDEVVAFTVKDNWPSRHLMEKLGMTHNQEDDFQHPSLPPEHALSWHVLYRLNKP